VEEHLLGSRDSAEKLDETVSAKRKSTFCRPLGYLQSSGNQRRGDRASVHMTTSNVRRESAAASGWSRNSLQ